MAIQRNDSVKASDLIPGASDTEITVDTVRRMNGIKWINHTELQVTFVVTRGNRVTDDSVIFGESAKPADPPADITDDDGNVLVPAGFYAPATPSLSQLRAMDVNGTLLGDALDSLKTMGYVLVQQLNPDWAGQQV